MDLTGRLVTSHSISNQPTRNSELTNDLLGRAIIPLCHSHVLALKGRSRTPKLHGTKTRGHSTTFSDVSVAPQLMVEIDEQQGFEIMAM